MKIIAIVGRPNVGKSSLFNRLLGENRTIVNPRAGVTRDRVYGKVEIEQKEFILVDTGGFEPGKKDRIKNLILKQTEAAIEEADLVLVLFDLKEGLLPADTELVDKLRKSQKRVIYSVNKVDSQKSEDNLNEFYRLGIEKYHRISAAHGTGIPDLLEEILKEIPEEPPEVVSEGGSEELRIAIVGRPNVGKSSIVNKLLKFERLMVDDTPGTTRDAVDTPFVYNGKKYLLIDTAGIRRRTRISDDLEAVSVMAALKAIEKAHFALLVIDASTEISSQDLKIADYALERGKGLMIVVNKIDKVPEFEDIDFSVFKAKVVKLYPSLSYCPFILTSVLLNIDIEEIMHLVEKMRKYYWLKIETKVLNKFFDEIKINRKLGYVKGRNGMKVKIKYLTQVGVAPPKFTIFTNNPEYLSYKYEKFILNQIRDKWSYDGVPIRLFFRK